jgi:flavin-dependent dehydrogenase
MGPAGAAFARFLKNYDAIIIDKKSDKKLDGAGFTKCCGGLIAPDAQALLAKFKLAAPKEILADPQLFYVKTYDFDSGAVKNYPRDYINVDRHKFDMWLASKVSRPVEFDSKLTQINRRDGFFEITYVKGGRSFNEKAKYIVAADGANSFVRRALFPDFKIRKYLAIQRWHAEKNKTPSYSCYFDSTLTDSYCWSLTKDDKFILGGAFPVQNAKKNFETLADKVKARGVKFGEEIKTEACAVLLPTAEFLTGGGGAFFIGEAAGFISPSSLEGISYALDSGYQLSRAFNKKEGFDAILKEYNKRALYIKARLILKNIKRPFMYNPALRKVVMKF